jgi:hypothetical protein
MRAFARSLCCNVALVLVPFFAVDAIEIAPSGDTWIHGADAYRHTNYGSGEYLKVRARSSRVALIRFDASALQAGATSATLDVHVSCVISGGAVQIRRVTSP